ncbi:MAG: hypothetical protein AAB467_02940 [Patescibacteria group bacterium]
MVKVDEQRKAIEMRRDGATYSEILKVIPVAKSTLSLWLRKVGLSVPQKQRITEKRLAAVKRGGLAKRQQRLDLIEQIEKLAISEIGKLDRKVFWMVGAALYWAEGNKQKSHDVSCPVKFSNSDPRMVRFFYKWLLDFCDLSVHDIYFEIYLHRGCPVDEIKKFWSDELGIGFEMFDRVRYKPNKFRGYKKNTGDEYHGLVRINVRRSANLNRKISGWVKGLCIKFGIN